MFCHHVLMIIMNNHKFSFLLLAAFYRIKSGRANFVPKHCFAKHCLNSIGKILDMWEQIHYNICIQYREKSSEQFPESKIFSE